MELPWVMRKALRLVSELQARMQRTLRFATVSARRGVNRRAERSVSRADSAR